MKKLALALVCLVSIAFFASCDPKVENPEPAIQVLEEAGFVKSGDVINEMDTIYFGFVVASNAETAEKLTSLVVTIDGAGFDTVNFTEETSEYTYKMGTVFEPQRDSIVGTRTIAAVVTDADGKTNTASIELTLNYHEQPLTVTRIGWMRKGSNLQGNTEAEMASFGLGWLKRDPYHANIRPLENCKLYVIENNAAEFEAITTVAEKTAYFAKLIEGGTAVEEYRNISVAANGEKEYNDILAVIDADGNQHLVLFRKANVLIESGIGVTTTIYGEAK